MQVGFREVTPTDIPLVRSFSNSSVRDRNVYQRCAHNMMSVVSRYQALTESAILAGVDCRNRHYFTFPQLALTHLDVQVPSTFIVWPFPFMVE